MAKVAVIVPVYNCSSFLPRCVESILSQTFSSIKLILVDDGSTDTSVTICDEYAQKDNRVRAIHQENGGVSLARYNGIQLVEEEWTCFVDADDYLPLNAIEVLIAAAEGMDLVNGQTCTFDSQNGMNPTPTYLPYELGTYTGTQYSQNLLLDRRNGALWRQIIKTKVLKQSLILIPREVKISEDWLLSISIGLNVKKCIGIPEVVYYYNDNPNSVTHQVGRTLDDIIIVEEYLERIIGDKTEFAEALFRCRLRHFRKCICDQRVMDTNFVTYLRKNKHAYNCDFKDKFLLLLINVKTTSIRCFIWKLFLLPNRIYNKFIYSLKQLNRR